MTRLAESLEMRALDYLMAKMRALDLRCSHIFTPLFFAHGNHTRVLALFNPFANDSKIWMPLVR
jgi:hypothetical protein